MEVFGNSQRQMREKPRRKHRRCTRRKCSKPNPAPALWLPRNEKRSRSLNQKVFQVAPVRPASCPQDKPLTLRSLKSSCRFGWENDSSGSWEEQQWERLSFWNYMTQRAMDGHPLQRELNCLKLRCSESLGTGNSHESGRLTSIVHGPIRDSPKGQL